MKNTQQTLSDKQINAIKLSLGHIKDPQTNIPITEDDRIESIIINNNRAIITISVAHNEIDFYNAIKPSITEHLTNTFKHTDMKFMVVFANHKKLTSHINKNDQTVNTNIKNIIVIASGKGGVGKSTTTANLAYALKAQGMTVGILDADIYGPSIPKMLNTHGKPTVNVQQQLNPICKDGIQFISMGLLLDQNSPALWRGPIAQRAVQQFIKDVSWSNIDVLLIDLPPGTGDIHLTLASKMNLTGAIIVSTPQDVALIDAEKAIAMFNKFDIPVIGLIENMSSFTCPHCQKNTKIFSSANIKNIAERMQIKVLTSIPLHHDIMHLNDMGKQSDILDNKELGEGYHKVAKYLIEKL